MTKPGKELPSDPIQFASIIAHQLKSPVAVVSTILSTLLGEFSGPLTPQQRDMLERALNRCNDSISASQRLMAISRAMSTPDAFKGSAEVTAIVRQARNALEDKARQQEIEIGVEFEEEPLFVQGHEPSLMEIVEELINNALKYTPQQGRVLVRVGLEAASHSAWITIEDSGIGIPEDQYEQIFQPFYRTPAANDSAAPGTGLGLAMAKAIIEAAEGAIQVGPSALGGAQFRITLPLQAEPVSELTLSEEPSMRVLIIGGVATGPKVAAKLSRLDPSAQVTIIEKGKLMSYAGCGLPYYVSGVVKDQNKLMSTPVGEVRNPIFFRKVKHIRVLNQTEATRIDRDSKQVVVRDLLSGQQSRLRYDTLVLATGGKPVIPPLPGIELRNIFTLHGVSDAEGIKANLEDGHARDVVIVGGGLIGIEITEALVQKGCRVTIVEQKDQILPMLDWEIARLIERHLESRGVKILLNTRVRGFQGEEKVARVMLENGVLPTEVVILAAGVAPDVDLARDAGLEIGVTGGIRVNELLQTSDPDIYAGGDCVETVARLTGKPTYVPLGSTANKQGRIIAINICGGEVKFPGIMETIVCQAFAYGVGKTGLTEKQARAEGFDPVTVLCPGPDREHFAPGAATLMLKLVADRKTRRLLGVQAIGPGGIDKRIDVAVTAITAGMTVDQLAHVDLGYSPPFSPVLDNIITAANVARNKLDGRFVGMTPMQLHEKLHAHEDLILLDVRTPAEQRQFKMRGSMLIPLGSLRARLHELDREKEVVTYCNYSLRGYEAAIILHHAGFEKVRVLDGGLVMWPFDLDHT